MNNPHEEIEIELFETQVTDEFPPGESSISDSERFKDFPALCGSAAKDTEIFAKFRSSKILYTILDHVTFDQGQGYITEILKYAPWSEEYTRALTQIDSLGKPRKYEYSPYGTFSPTLLRYLKVYLELKDIFGILKNFDVTEIGIGFGGQASVIGLLDKPLSYHSYDIPPVLELAKRFMTELGVPGELIFSDGRTPMPSKSDLVISNYAFSELSLNVQNHYLDNVILPSPRGYMTWNSLSHDLLGGHGLLDLISIIPNSQIIPERPNSFNGNAVIVWGN